MLQEELVRQFINLSALQLFLVGVLDTDIAVCLQILYERFLSHSKSNVHICNKIDYELQ
jgi:hypothetical protein